MDMLSVPRCLRGEINFPALKVFIRFYCIGLHTCVDIMASDRLLLLAFKLRLKGS